MTEKKDGHVSIERRGKIITFESLDELLAAGFKKSEIPMTPLHKKQTYSRIMDAREEVFVPGYSSSEMFGRFRD